MVNSIDKAMFLKRTVTFPRHLNRYLWDMEIHIYKKTEKREKIKDCIAGHIAQE